MEFKVLSYIKIIDGIDIKSDEKCFATKILVDIDYDKEKNTLINCYIYVATNLGSIQVYNLK